jgi:hypothetical protein
LKPNVVLPIAISWKGGTSGRSDNIEEKDSNLGSDVCGGLLGTGKADPQLILIMNGSGGILEVYRSGVELGLNVRCSHVEVRLVEVLRGAIRAMILMKHGFRKANLDECFSRTGTAGDVIGNVNDRLIIEPLFGRQKQSKRIWRRVRWCSDESVLESLKKDDLASSLTQGAELRDMSERTEIGG